ncbi:MAG: Crp/Fnr family transcriptional regulator [Desulfovibrio sp.]|jgi:CRP-like cAMP-binding protein|nr:Crp/Fnr family transcriptional regulator [Desulfovibrio sp.]
MSTHIRFYPIVLQDLNKPWEQMLHTGYNVSFPAGSVITGVGRSREDNRIFFIRQGRVCLSHIAANGEERILMYLGRNCMFEETPTQHDGMDCIFTCVKELRAVSWPAKILNANFAALHPELVLNLLCSLSRKTRIFSGRLCELHAFDALGLVCRALYSMYLHRDEGKSPVPNLTQLELAAYLGIHRSSLHLVMSKLREDGIIGAYSKSRVEILDPDRLLACALSGRGKEKKRGDDYERQAG